MQFRDLKRQYQVLKDKLDPAISEVLTNADFISGSAVSELERELAEYVGVKHCITCANGTDALTLALMAWGIGEGDAVFVPDFTFFATAETVAYEGAVPVFVDVEESSFNLLPQSLEKAVCEVLKQGKLTPRAIIAGDLFGQSADFVRIRTIAKRYGLLLLEDGAQGFGGRIGEKRACSFGDISTTSFFPAKPLGCYGDGGAVFTDHDSWAELIRSFRVHGKGKDKYDNIRVGMNSRLDTLQAAVLRVKLEAFREYELEAVNCVAARYADGLNELVEIPIVEEGFYSSFAQYSILLASEKEREGLKEFLKKRDIPSMVYYPKAMHELEAFRVVPHFVELNNASDICGRVLALPIHPYLTEEEQDKVIGAVKDYFLR